MVNASSQWTACADVHYLLQTRPVLLLWFNQNVDLTIFSSIKSKIIWWRRLLLDFVTKGSKYLVVWGAVNNIVMYRVQPEIKSWFLLCSIIAEKRGNWKKQRLFISVSLVGFIGYITQKSDCWVPVTHHYWAFGYVLGLILLDDHESSEWVYYIQHTHNIPS